MTRWRYKKQSNDAYRDIAWITFVIAVVILTLYVV